MKTKEPELKETKAMVKGEFEVVIANKMPVSWLVLYYTDGRKQLFLKTEVRNNG